MMEDLVSTEYPMDVTEEFKKFVKENCSKITGNEIIDTKFLAKTKYYRYKGLVFSDYLLIGHHKFRDINVHKDDIIVTSFPKTGTTWMQEITYLVQNEGDQSKANTICLAERFPFLEFHRTPLDLVNSMPSPRLLKSHLPYSMMPDGDCNKQYKMIYICRNPKDTVVSVYFFHKSVQCSRYVGTLSETVDLFINDLIMYSPFAQHVLDFWEKSKTNKNILFLQYEDLHRNLGDGIKKVAQFLGKTLSEQQILAIADRCTFATMSTHPTSSYSSTDNIVMNPKISHFLRKGKVGDWKNHLSAEDNKKMDYWINKQFGHSDFKFTYE